MKRFLPLLLLLGCSVPSQPDIDVSQTVTASVSPYVVILGPGVEPRGWARAEGVAPTRVFNRLGAFVAQLTDAEVRALRGRATVSRVRSYTLHEAPWHLDRIDQRTGFDGSYSADYTGAGVTAYVVDTGIRASHADFGGRVTFGTDVTGGDGSDCFGHGTSVAGVLGGTTYGVAPDVSIVNVRIFDCSGSATDIEVLAAMEWVLGNVTLPAVLNASWGGSELEEDVTAMEIAIQRVIDAGVTVAASAGNSSTDACFFTPARMSTVITLGATRQDDARASFSNFGTCVDLFAPGQSVQAPDEGSDTGIAGVSGTSFSSPITAGVVALILEENPSLSPTQVAEVVAARSSKEVVGDARSPDWDLVYSGTDTQADPADPANQPPEAWFGHGCPGIGSNCLADQSTDDRGIVRREWRINRQFVGDEAILVGALPECDGRTQVQLTVWDTGGLNDSVKRNLRTSGAQKCKGRK
jgi:subtilisin family serine protease